VPSPTTEDNDNIDPADLPAADLDALGLRLAGLDLDAGSTLHAVVMSVDTQITTERVR